MSKKRPSKKKTDLMMERENKRDDKIMRSPQFIHVHVNKAAGYYKSLILIHFNPPFPQKRRNKLCVFIRRCDEMSIHPISDVIRIYNV